MTDSKNGKISLNFKRICACPENWKSCLDRKTWFKRQEAIWRFFYCASDLEAKKFHPAVFPLSLAKTCIETFSHEGELVLDPFAGSGTTLLAAKECNRSAVGFDLNPDYVELANSRLRQRSLFESQGILQVMICDDAKNIPSYLEKESASLVLTSPPYAEILSRPISGVAFREGLLEAKRRRKGETRSYSKSERDLGNLDVIDYLTALGEIFEGIFPLVKVGGDVCIVITDISLKGRRIRLSDFVLDVLEEIGFQFANRIIWDKRILVRKAGLFGWPSNFLVRLNDYEFILHLIKPS